MDLGTIEKRIFDGFYSTVDEFAADVRLVWTNAQKYNRPESDIYKMSESLSKVFERKYTKFAKQTVKNKRKKVHQQREVTREDRISFEKLMREIHPDQLGLLMENIREQCPGAMYEEHDNVEIEIDKIDSATLLDQIEYCKACIKQNAGVSGGAGASEEEPSTKKQKR
mmetsp:Transcript_14354/g.20040  ORF Transcript_14354/g.20040 Transcript_14354/m.20040 type:complete len:168 (-) Transcript_14354:40-543(-)